MDILSGKMAVVTGGATGIGAATVERQAMLGADVACCYNKSCAEADAPAHRLRERGREILPVKIDVSQSREVEAGIEAIVSHFGRAVNILVNNAGDVFATAPLDQIEEWLWNKVIDVNLKGAYLCAKYCMPGTKAAQAGRIINVTSISARTGGGPGAAHYVASKGGLEALTRAMALELAPYHVTVNAVSPGVIDTPIHQRTNTPGSLERLRQQIPLARLGKPEEVARVIAFLAFDDASYITGEIIAINGGKRLD
jgi:3-oxoacyl-[acyl-carrier protein] reductase